MARFAAFLRAINVGGRRVTNDDLKAAAEAAGFEDAATFRASGNLIVSTGMRSPERITSALEDGLEDAIGFEVPVMLRDADAVRAIAAADPFDGARTAGPKGKLQVLLLEKAPPKKARDEVLALATTDDRLAIEGSELYWLPSGATMESELDTKLVGELLGAYTQRTMGTIEQITSKHLS